MTDVSDKVQGIFRRIVGERAAILKGSHFPAAVNTRITAAILGGELGSNINDPVKLDEIGFHLVDWNSDAAFIVALLLFPDEFTDEEIRDGVELFLVHAPGHCIEAARLGGYSTDNTFMKMEQKSCAEPGAPPNGGPAEPLGDSVAGGGPPSVS
jgi:hypothetical protein